MRQRGTRRGVPPRALSYGDYVEQLTYLLFLKMAHEQTQPPWRRASAIPAGYDWPSLIARDGDELEDSANLPDPDVIAAEIVEDLRAALEEFETVLTDLTPA